MNQTKPQESTRCQGANASQTDSLKTQVNKKTMDTAKVNKIINATRNLF